MFADPLAAHHEIDKKNLSEIFVCSRGIDGELNLQWVIIEEVSQKFDVISMMFARIATQNFAHQMEKDSIKLVLKVIWIILDGNLEY